MLAKRSLSFFIALGLALVTVTTASSLPLVTSPDNGANPFLVRYQAVEVEVNNHLIRTTVVQQIYNDSDKEIPCFLDLKLPEGGRASAFSAVVDGKELVGQIKRKQVAREIVNEARKQKVAAALAEENGDNLHVELSLVKPHQEFLFRVSYIEQATYSAGAFHYYFGVMSSNRELPKPEALSMSIKFNCSAGLLEAKSDTHEMTGTIEVNKAAFEVRNIAEANHDFHMSYILDLKPGIPHVMVKDTANEDPYFCLLMLPPDLPVMDGSRAIAFIIDKSGSMAGEKFTLAVQALEAFIARLNDKDLVNVYIYDTQTYACSPLAFLADEAGKKAAVDFIHSYNAEGGTLFLEPLAKSIKSLMLDNERTPAVVLLTDGQDNENSAADFVTTIDALSKFKVPIFTFGIGSDLNFPLLRSLAALSGATMAHIEKPADTAPALLKVAEKFDRLVASSVSLSTEGKVGYQQYPIRLSGIYSGEPIIIYGRLDDAGAVKMTLSADVLDKKWAEEFVLSTVGERVDCEYLDSMWAARRMVALLDQVIIFGQTQQLRSEIILLSERFLITSPYTSLVFCETNIEPKVTEEEELLLDEQAESAQGSGGAYGGRKGSASAKSTGSQGNTPAPGTNIPPNSQQPVANTKNAQPSKDGAESEKKHREKAIDEVPLLSDTFELNDISGKPLLDQYTAHIHALALLSGSRENFDKNIVTPCMAWLLKSGQIGKATDLLSAATESYALAFTGPASPEKTEALVASLQALSALDATVLLNGKDDDYAALAALYIAALCEGGHKLPDSLIHAIRSDLLLRMKIDPTKVPTGKGIDYIARWCEWFPIAVACAKGLGISVPQADKMALLLELAITSEVRSAITTPDLPFYVAWSRLLRAGIAHRDLGGRLRAIMEGEAPHAAKTTEVVYGKLSDRAVLFVFSLLR